MSAALIEEIFRAAVAACDGERLTAAALRRDGAALEVRRPGRGGAPLGRLLLPAGPIAVLAVGKAALAQARALAAALPVARAVAIVPAAAPPGAAPPPFRVLGAGHPLPDEGSLRAGAAALELARSAAPDGWLVCAVSGGASALMELPAADLSLADLRAATAALLAAGADIATLNAVRCRLSALKGGGLAAAAAAPTVSLVLADVPGDRADLVGSGPATPPADPAGAQARIEAVLSRAEVLAQLPPAVHRLLAAPAPRWTSAGPAPAAWVIAGPEDLRAAAAAAARDRALTVVEEPGRLEGDVRDLAQLVLRRGAALRSGELWVAVAEPTVELSRPAGAGGRAAHLALLAARELGDRAGLTLLCAGSDGVDGDSDAAGAVVDEHTWERARAAGCDPESALRRCDSATLHRAIGTAVVTGPTQTNLNDLLLLLRS